MDIHTEHYPVINKNGVLTQGLKLTLSESEMQMIVLDDFLCKNRSRIRNHREA